MNRPSLNMVQTSVLAVVAAAGLALATGLLSTWSEAKGNANLDPILVGVSNVQSGSAASLGIALMAGSTAYFDVVNAQGGIHGRPLAFILKDDGYEPDPAVKNTYSLITQDNVLFLFNYVGTPTLTRVLPLLKFFEDRQIVNVAPFTGADPQRTPPFDKYVFNIRASYRQETRILVDYFLAKGYRKIGLLTQADAYGKSGEVGVRMALTAHGQQPVGIVTFRRNQPFDVGMQQQVTLLRESGADVVIAIGTYEPCAAFIRDARRVGWNVPIANVSFVGPQALVSRLRQASVSAGMDLTANLINSQVVPSPDDTRYPLVRDYRTHMAPDSVGFTSLEGWLNAVVAAEALRRAGPNPSRGSFIQAMESLGSWDPGLGLKLGFSTADHQGLQKVWLTKTEQGQWVPEPVPGEVQ